MAQAQRVATSSDGDTTSDVPADSEADEWPDVPMTVAEVLVTARDYLNYQINVRAYEPAVDYLDPRIFEHVDVKHHLRLMLDLVEEDCPVELNLTKLKNDTCCYTWQDNLVTTVKRKIRQDISTSLPLLVLTEGSTDALAIDRTIRITHPHLVGFVNVMDFSLSPIGSVSGMIKNLKALIAGGVPNRIVAVADNDSAAREALDAKFVSGLPSNVKVLHNPILESMKSYPAFDHDGNIVDTDVNGRAGSLEMYFGSDILSTGGSRPPVRWSGFQSRIKEYQGVVETKNELSEAFRKKSSLQLLRLKQNPSSELEGDWGDMKAIVDAIVHAFD